MASEDLAAKQAVRINPDVRELSDEELEGIADGASQTGAMTCTYDECGAVLNGEDEVMNHYLMTNHCSYHYKA